MTSSGISRTRTGTLMQTEPDYTTSVPTPTSSMNLRIPEQQLTEHHTGDTNLLVPSR